MYSFTVCGEALGELGIGCAKEGDLNLATNRLRLDRRRRRVWTRTQCLTRSRYLGLRRANINSFGSIHSCNTVVDTIESALDASSVGRDMRNTQWISC